MLQVFKVNKEEEFKLKLRQLEVKQGQPFEIDQLQFTPIHCDPFLKGRIDENTLVIAIQSEEKRPVEPEFQEPSLGLWVPVVLDTMETKDHIGYTSWSNLASMGYIDGDWVEITCDKKCWLQIFGDDNIEENIVFISKRIYSYVVKTGNHGYASKLEIESLMDIPVAKHVVLSRLSTPLSQNQILYDAIPQALKKYFGRTNRLVMPNFVFDVPVDYGNMLFSKTLGIPDLDIEEIKQEKIVYFQVVEIEPPGVARVDISCTNLTEQPAIQDFIPCYDPIPSFDYCAAFKTLQDEVQASIHPIAKEYGLFTSVFLYGPPGCGKTTMIDTVAKRNGLNVVNCNCFILLQDTIEKTASELEKYTDMATKTSPCILLLRHFEALSESWTGQTTSDSKGFLSDVLKKLSEVFSTTGHPVVLIASAPDAESVKEDLRQLFSLSIQVSMPNESQRQSILEHQLENVKVSPLVDFRQHARATAGLSGRDLALCASRSSEEKTKDLDEIKEAGIQVTNVDLTNAIEAARSAHSNALGVPKIPTVFWEDIGGLDYVRDTILETIQLPLLHPELFSNGIKKRSGVLLYGPPGTGKTLVAKAVATTLKLNFFSVKGPELLNMYIGESEANVRKVFQKARDAKPCVIFFDELDSIAPQRGDQGDSGGVMDRIVSQLLAELDGMSPSGDVFVIGATNRPDLLDSALLRPGRFDKLLYLGVSDTNERQAQQLKALTRKFNLEDDCDLDIVAENCPFHLTGADFYALCTDAMLKAMSRTIAKVDKELEEWNQSGPHDNHPHPTNSVYYLEHIANPDDIVIKVGMQDFLDALRELTPSVSPKELARYKRIRDQFEP